LKLYLNLNHGRQSSEAQYASPPNTKLAENYQLSDNQIILQHLKNVLYEFLCDSNNVHSPLCTMVPLILVMTLTLTLSLISNPKPYS